MLLPRLPSPSLIRSVNAFIILGITGLLLYHYWSRAVRQYQPAHALPSTGIPKKIWYKLGAKGLSAEARHWTDSCIQKNPGYQAEFLTDAMSDIWVRKTFASRPDIVEIYLGLSVPILKADLLRYLLLFAEGGIWSDLDVSCKDVPIDDWIPSEYKKDAALVVGWEFDVILGVNVVHQLSTWMILAKPGLPHMMVVIEDILHGLRDVAAENNVAVANVTLTMVGNVVDFTGPRRFSRSVFKSLKKTLDVTDDEFMAIEAGTRWLLKPVLVGDILILPGYSLAALTNIYAETDVVGPPLVEHHYAGSWKNEHGGEQA